MPRVSHTSYKHPTIRSQKTNGSDRIKGSSLLTTVKKPQFYRLQDRRKGGQLLKSLKMMFQNGNISTSSSSSTHSYNLRNPSAKASDRNQWSSYSARSERLKKRNLMKDLVSELSSNSSTPKSNASYLNCQQAALNHFRINKQAQVSDDRHVDFRGINDVDSVNQSSSFNSVYQNYQQSTAKSINFNSEEYYPTVDYMSSMDTVSEVDESMLDTTEMTMTPNVKFDNFLSFKQEDVEMKDASLIRRSNRRQQKTTGPPVKVLSQKTFQKKAPKPKTIELMSQTEQKLKPKSFTIYQEDRDLQFSSFFKSEFKQYETQKHAGDDQDVETDEENVHYGRKTLLNELKLAINSFQKEKQAVEQINNLTVNSDQKLLNNQFE